MNIDPRMMTVTEWTDFMAPLLEPFGRMPRLDNPEFWKEWALTLIQRPAIQHFCPPDPRYFEDWEEWAFRFNQAVPL